MACVLIRFIIRLGDVNFAGGPLFHRWLPRGIDDSIEANVEVGHLQLWFERRGYTENGMVRFSFERHDVEESIVKKQGRLDAGPLFGTLNVENVADNVMEGLRRDLTSDPACMEFGKRIVKSVYPVIERLAKHLRVQYGQHWLTPPEKWDSRYRSLGALCADWNMSWSEDDGQTWHPFKPDNSVRNYGPLEQTKFNEYLTQEDWLAVKSAVEKGDAPTLAAELAANSHRLISDLEMRHALVEACSALEVAISEAVRTPIKASSKLTDTVASFLKDTSLKARLVVVASLVGNISSDLLEEALGVIDLRNRIVHDGFIPEERDMRLVRAVLEIVARVLPGSLAKFPVQSASNFIAETHDWERSGGYSPLVVGGISIAEA
jgi:hypothetical protein